MPTTTTTTRKNMTATHPENMSPYIVSYLHTGNSLSYMFSYTAERT